MSYEKVGWKDYPNKTTPVNAVNLDQMDSQIKENADNIGDVAKIADIGDGTAAGAIASINSDLDTKLSYVRDVTSEDKTFDNLTKVGIYRVTSEIIVTLENRPFDNACLIEILSNATGSRVLQRATRYGTDGYCAFRTYVAGEGWREWAYHAVKEDVYFKSGELLSVDKLNTFAGTITSSGKKLYFTIPLCKNANELSVSIICNNMSVRNADGYVLENINISNYTFNTYVNNNLLTICVENEATFNVTNNSNVSVSGSFDITFE